jgi:hypothetical protein
MNNVEKQRCEDNMKSLQEVLDEAETGQLDGPYTELIIKNAVDGIFNAQQQLGNLPLLQVSNKRKKENQ